jgi:hypothetical protein
MKLNVHGVINLSVEALRLSLFAAIAQPVSTLNCDRLERFKFSRKLNVWWNSLLLVRILGRVGNAHTTQNPDMNTPTVWWQSMFLKMIIKKAERHAQPSETY